MIGIRAATGVGLLDVQDVQLISDFDYKTGQVPLRQSLIN